MSVGSSVFSDQFIHQKDNSYFSEKEIHRHSDQSTCCTATNCSLQIHNNQHHQYNHQQQQQQHIQYRSQHHHNLTNNSHQSAHHTDLTLSRVAPSNDSAMKDELHSEMLRLDKSNINMGRASQNDFNNGILVTPRPAIASSSSSSSSSVGLLHSGHQSFTCDICGKTLSRRDHLKLHKTIHTGVRPYRCDTCGCTFSRNHHLMRHMGSHLSEKKFKCDICGKALSRSDHLKVHRRIHTGERPFKCQICGFAFSRRDRLVKHNQLSKGKRKLSCVPPTFTSQAKQSIESNSIEINASDQLTVNFNPATPSPLQCHQQHHTSTNNDNDSSDRTHKETAYVFLNTSTSNCKQESSNAHQDNSNQPQLTQQEIVKSHSTNLTTINENSLPTQVTEILTSEENAKMPVILANSGHQVESVLPVFPATIQMHPTIFPTLQMYTSAAPLNIPSSHIYVTK